MKGQLAKEQVEILEKKLNYLEKQLEETYFDAGRQMLEQASKIAKVSDGLVDENIALKQEISTLKNQKECFICFKINEQDSVYCKYCGQKFPKGVM